MKNLTFVLFVSALVACAVAADDPTKTAAGAAANATAAAATVATTLASAVTTAAPTVATTAASGAQNPNLNFLSKAKDMVKEAEGVMDFPKMAFNSFFGIS